MKNDLSEKRIRSFYNFEGEINILPTVDSTNSFARRLIKSGKGKEQVIIAKQQTVGRGRRGNSFFSPDSGLYYSYIHRAFDVPNETADTILAATAACQAAEVASGTYPMIKWVNDLYLGDRKVAGILCEKIQDINLIDWIIIGIGFNIGTLEFPDDLKSKATSLPENTDRSLLAAELTKHLCAYLNNQNNSEILSYYRNRSLVLGEKISYIENGIYHSGIAEAIQDDGTLEVKEGDGTHCVRSGEVSIHRE